MTRDQIRAAAGDVVALTATLYGEASGEPVASQIAVGCVIRNRVFADVGHDGKPDWWGESFAGVCLARAQFSCWWESNPNTDRVYALAEALVLRQPIGQASIVAELQWIAHGLIESQLRDLTHGATHYLTAALLAMAPPAWTKNQTPVAAIGRHVFFKLS